MIEHEILRQFGKKIILPLIPIYFLLTILSIALVIDWDNYSYDLKKGAKKVYATFTERRTDAKLRDPAARDEQRSRDFDSLWGWYENDQIRKHGYTHGPYPWCESPYRERVIVNQQNEPINKGGAKL